MKIKISNLGAIKEGTIDLTKRINLFCGHNGTGKTYLAYVIYGLLMRNDYVDNNFEIIEKLFTDHKITTDIDFESVFSFKQKKLDYTKTSLDDIFGIYSSDTDILFPKFNIEDIETKEEFKNRIISAEFKNTISETGISLTKIKNESTITLSLIDENIANISLFELKFFLKSYIENMFALYPISNAIIFSIERNSINTFSKQLSIRKKEILDNIDKENEIIKLLNAKNFKRYPLPISDGLKIADDLAEIKKQRSEFYDFAEELEKELLYGQVSISNDGEILFTPNKSTKIPLPIQMTASIIKTLSSLVVYLKHSAKKNDLIIIDEPEINLHPENQIILTRIFARLANKGFRFLISTHSDYIVREFNNLLILSNKNKTNINKAAKDFGYKEDEFINKDDLGVYSFTYKTNNSKQVVVEEIPISETGFNIELMDSVIDRQNDITETLYYSLKYDEDDE